MNITFSELKELISIAKNKAKVEANKQYSVVRSRGNEFVGVAAGCADPYTEVFFTKTDLTLTFTKAMDKHEIVEVYVQGAFDGANSLHDLNNSMYDPLVEEWAIKIWDKAQGHYTYDMIESQLELN